MLVDLPRRWRWGIGAACAVALVLALVFVGAVRRAERLAPVAAPASAVRADLVAVTGIVPDLSLLVPDNLESRGADEVQLCGGAWLRVPRDGAPDDAEIERATHAGAIRARMLEALRAQPDARSQAAALYLTQALGRIDDSRAADVACAGADNCGGMFARSPRTDAVTSELARFAATAGDGQVYAWALNACGMSRGADAPAACAALSIDQWARLDPDNATPWMAVLSAAQQRHDAAAANEALYRIATAKRDDVGWAALPGLMLDHADTDDASLTGTMLLTTELLGVQAAIALPAYQSVTQMCRGELLRDANRLQVCAQVAEVLVSRSDTLISRGIGTALGERAGWDADRLDRLRGEYAAYLSASDSRLQADATGLPGVSQQCDAIRRELDRVRAMAARGETGELNAWVAQSGKQPDDFIREQRARREQSRLDAITAAASGAASTAGVASGGR